MLCPLSGAGVFCLLQDLERIFPVLTLHFSYIRKDRQKRKYVVLDDCPEQCVQVGEAGGGSLGRKGGLLEDAEFFQPVQGPCFQSTCACAALWQPVSGSYVSSVFPLLHR